tara:strand:+ start:951 stop:1157 length:207 start_codon:yes stop_codon:yes gene_type:complete
MTLSHEKMKSFGAGIVLSTGIYLTITGLVNNDHLKTSGGIASCILGIYDPVKSLYDHRRNKNREDYVE